MLGNSSCSERETHTFTPLATADIIKGSFYTGNAAVEITFQTGRSILHKQSETISITQAVFILYGRLLIQK